MVPEVGFRQLGQCLLRLGEVVGAQGREVYVFGGARARHSGEHAHPALVQPLGLLSLGEDARQEPVIAGLPDLRIDAGGADTGPAWAAVFFAASLIASSRERQSPYPPGSASSRSAMVPALRAHVRQLEQIAGQ